MTRYQSRFWSSRDGLKLHYRDYAGGDAVPIDGRPPILCFHGLTRNARDFEALAERLSPQWRVICPELRGRGESEYARDSTSYKPQQYVEDVSLLLDELGIDRFVAVGTSLGGLMTMLFAATAPERVAGAVLNDVGPYLEPEGLEFIKSYVGQGRSFPTWVHAARGLEEMHGRANPGKDLPFWIAAAKRVMTLGSNARIVFDYDMKIAEPFAQLDPAAEQYDMWPALDALRGRPVLILRGALSDLLSTATLDRMLARLPDAEAVTVPDVGHPPTLSEPEAQAAIDRLLARVA
ncbi:pimeloyl-ACP methyl ester carboxylesterase [Novosphingobium chloroacetimidivorans]|uniref:Pimeloyl-ACP methyl ester carboxylesterase n=1 Tax=Novosphingobium chloroacetimidivorans TaxID=1428314 RepID=A0A7W7K782_9SPHN|nr:alpha/beta hydrolase [Novosphingobium chloroacetimidivorans]MBB4857522.1 pimeloyl-ACP methyl ester carboxylesterase [Novosphingobium chloroacetimidivorans]